MSAIEEAISKTIERYNSYRSPEVTAKLVEVGDGGFLVDFDGTFCRSCSIYDYFEDLIYELKSTSSIKAEIEGFESTESESIRVKYAIK
ncbi:MAG: hypothetical protein ACUVTL_03545 [Thermoproteota archaeon]